MGRLRDGKASRRESSADIREALERVLETQCLHEALDTIPEAQQRKKIREGGCSAIDVG
jgi:hypothetical protein